MEISSSAAQCWMPLHLRVARLTCGERVQESRWVPLTDETKIRIEAGRYLSTSVRAGQLRSSLAGTCLRALSLCGHVRRVRRQLLPQGASVNEKHTVLTCTPNDTLASRTRSLLAHAAVSIVWRGGRFTASVETCRRHWSHGVA
jgi:hypothetical protein